MSAILNLNLRGEVARLLRQLACTKIVQIEQLPANVREMSKAIAHFGPSRAEKQVHRKMSWLGKDQNANC